MALLLAKKISISKKYANFSDVFFKKSVAMLFNCLKINKHAIDQELGKQSPYGLIYSLGQVEFEIFKTFIKTNLANEFI